MLDCKAGLPVRQGVQRRRPKIWKAEDSNSFTHFSIDKCKQPLKTVVVTSCRGGQDLRP